MLYDCQTRIDLLCEVVQLQSFSNAATWKQLRAANSLLAKGHKNDALVGLHFPRLRGPLKLVMASDAGHATKHSSYAHEGKLVLLMTDVPVSPDRRDDSSR